MNVRQICSEEDIDEHIVESMKVYFQSFARAYQNVLQKQEREFFGLRDFYRLEYVNSVINLRMQQFSEDVVLDVQDDRTTS